MMLDLTKTRKGSIPKHCWLQVSVILITILLYITEARRTSWQVNTDLERDQSLMSPVKIGRAAQIFNGRPYQDRTINSNDQYEYVPLQQQQQQQSNDIFKCVNPDQGLFEQFAIQYNRTFSRGGSSLAERQQLFDITLRRTIMLNRIIQNEVLNVSNYNRKPKVGNYYFVSPMGDENFAPWYADITDCELGLIKKIVFDIFDLIDRNELDIAYVVAYEKSRHLPIFNEDGFEQLANILLVRLYDRFEGDKKMFQLFQWPMYMKKLASYAYNRQQVSQPNFNAKLSLITYAYPSYFKDLKYNQQAINRTGDNWKVHWEHEKFNRDLGRQFTNLQDRNRRLAIFRQHWTAINLLNDDKKWNVSVEPDWLRAQQYQPDLYSVTNARLLQQQDGGDDQSSSLQQQQQQQSSFAPSLGNSRFRQTSFSDLTDAEFVAYLTNDFSLLETNPESAKFLDTNFPIKPLTREFRDEIAAELEMRKLMQLPKLQQDQSSTSSLLQKRSTYSLARQVVDELINDVGLPIGPASVDNISEQEHFSAFNTIRRFFDKNYLPGSLSRSNGGGGGGGGLTETDLTDENLRRFSKFKENHGRFRAWMMKENWKIDDNRLIYMLRLSDMSWQDIKLTLFKICCLAKPVLEELSATNSSIRYLGSNDYLCQPMTQNQADEENIVSRINSNNNNNNNINNQQQNSDSDGKSVRDLVALELYYIYSVHFNKHHDDMETFKRKFAIFRHNIDRIRWHSCTRGLTLYNSLRTKNFDSLNTIDVLDPRRSYTDDINLDRFRYFNIPDLGSISAQQNDDLSESGLNRLRDNDRDSDFTFASQTSTSTSTSSRSADGSRAGVSYRREPFFTSVLQETERRPKYPRQQVDNYAERLTLASQDYIRSARKYKNLGVSKVYDLVMLGYSDCMKATRGIDVDYRDLTPKQCLAGGSLGDAASMGLLSVQQYGPYAEKRQQELQKDSCSLYWQGLHPWSEGLISQDQRSGVLIQLARC